MTSPPAVAVAVLAGALVTTLAGCGSDRTPDVGQLVAETPSVTESPAASDSSGSTDGGSDPADPSSGRVKGAGTYIYNSGGVVASLRLPADSKQEDVTALQTFLRKAHSTPVRLISVTVTNRSTKAFSVSGFTLRGSPNEVQLFPAASYVNLAMAMPGVGKRPDLVSSGTVALLTSAVKIPPGAEMTTLVGTQQVLDSVTTVTYENGSQKVTLQPLWAIKQAAAKLARQQAAAARRLARQQAAAARRAARERARHKSAAGRAAR